MINKLHTHFRLIISSFLMILAFLFAQYFSESRDVAVLQRLENFPQRIGEWQGINDIPLSQKTLEILKVNDYLFRNYISRESQAINLYIGYFESQKQGKQIHSPKHCMPGSGWEDGRYQTQWVPLDSSKKNGVNINKYVVSKGTEKNLVFYWYQGRERITTNEYKDRILLIWDAITKQRTDGALVRIVIPLKSSDGGEEIQCGIEFIQKVIPILGDYLPS